MMTREPAVSCAKAFQAEGRFCALAPKALMRKRFGVVGPYKERASHYKMLHDRTIKLRRASESKDASNHPKDKQKLFETYC